MTDLLSDAVQSLARRRHVWLETQLAALAAGETLCVHEKPAAGDLYTLTFHMEAHVLGPEGCDAPTRVSQYGPMTAEIKAQAERTTT